MVNECRIEEVAHNKSNKDKMERVGVLWIGAEDRIFFVENVRAQGTWSSMWVKWFERTDTKPTHFPWTGSLTD